MWSTDNCREIISEWAQNTIYKVDLRKIDSSLISNISKDFEVDYEQYYPNQRFEISRTKYYPGLLATFFYRISRYLYLSDDESQAREFSSVGFALSAMEIYYSSNIKSGLKINHGIGTVIGARVKVGHNALFHHNVTLGDKNGGRPKLGDGVIVYPGAVIIGDIEIGDNCIIGANTTILKSVAAGSKVVGVFK